MAFFTFGEMHIRSRRGAFRSGEGVIQGERVCGVILEEANFHLTAVGKCEVQAVMPEILETKPYVGRGDIHFEVGNLESESPS